MPQLCENRHHPVPVGNPEHRQPLTCARNKATQMVGPVGHKGSASANSCMGGVAGRLGIPNAGEMLASTAAEIPVDQWVTWQPSAGRCNQPPNCNQSISAPNANGNNNHGARRIKPPARAWKAHAIIYHVSAGSSLSTDAARVHCTIG